MHFYYMLKKKLLDFSCFSLSLLAYSTFINGNLIAELDLEQEIQSFVQETKRIYIEDYPNAFNPSIIRWKGSILMSFRFVPDLTRPYYSELGLVWLDEDFIPKSQAQVLNTKGSPFIQSRAEDARLIKIQEDLYIVYSNNEDEKISRGGFRVYYAKLELEGKEFILSEKERLSDFEGETKKLREKNWVPFDFNDSLMLAYSISPHLIFQPIGNEKCETIAKTFPLLSWPWGEIRGGTPALKIDGAYLAFFHSSTRMESKHSNGVEMRHYFTGAYTFNLEPPFALTKISRTPIIGKDFYNGDYYKPYWGSPIRVVFPGGFICDENQISIVYGRQDHELWVMKLDKKGLMKSLIPINEEH